jgi:hypothetical protein
MLEKQKIRYAFSPQADTKDRAIPDFNPPSSLESALDTFEGALSAALKEGQSGELKRLQQSVSQTYFEHLQSHEVSLPLKQRVLALILRASSVTILQDQIALLDAWHKEIGRQQR